MPFPHKPQSGSFLDGAREHLLNKGSLNAVYNDRSLPLKNLESQRPINTEVPKGYKGAITGYEDNLMLHQAEQQSNLNRWANGLARLGLTAVTKAGATAGHFLGGANAIYDGDTERVTSNVIAKMFHGAEEWLKEDLFPIYHRKKYTDGTLLQQMATPEFWAEEVFDGLAFLLSAYAGGHITRPLQIGKKFTGATRGKELSNKALRAIVGKDGQRWNHAMVTAYNVMGQSGMEAFEGGKIVQMEIEDELEREYTKMRAQREKELRNLPSNISSADRERLRRNIENRHAQQYNAVREDLIGKRAEVQKNIYLGNLAMLSVPKSWESSVFFGSGRANRQLLKGMFKEGVLNPAAKTTASKLGRKWGAEAIKGFVAEGIWENNAQVSIQEYERRRSMEGDDQARILAIASEMVNNFTHVEGQKAIVVGGIIGLFGATGKVAREAKGENKRKAQMQSLIDVGHMLYDTNLGSLYKTFTVANPDAKDGESQTKEVYKNPETGLYEFNPEAVMRLSSQLLADSKLMDETVAATLKNDNLHGEMNKAIALSRIVNYYMGQEGGEAVMDAMIESISKDSEDLSGIHLLAENKALYSKLKELHRTIEDSKGPEVEDKDRNDFNEKTYRARFYQGSKLIALQNALSLSESKLNGVEILGEKESANIQKSIEGIKILIEDTVNSIKNLKDNSDQLYTDRQKILEPVKEKITRITELKKKEDISESEKKELRILEYEIAETRAIEGQLSPLAITVKESNRLDFKEGIRHKVAKQLAEDALMNSKIDQAIEEGRSFSHIADMIQQKHYVSEADNQLLQELQQKMSENLSTQEQAVENNLPDYQEAHDQLDVLLGEGVLEDLGITPDIPPVSETIAELREIAKEMGLDDQQLAKADDLIDRLENQANLQAELDSSQQQSVEAQRKSNELKHRSAVEQGAEGPINLKPNKFQKELNEAFERGELEEFLEKAYLDELLTGTHAFTENFRKADPNEFFRADQAFANMLQVQGAIEVYEGRNTDGKFDTTLKELRRIEKELKNIFDIAERNINDVQKRQLLALNQEQSRMLKGIGIVDGQVDSTFQPILVSILGFDVLQNLLGDIAKSGNPVYADILLELVRTKADVSQKTALKLAIEGRLESASKAITEVSKKGLGQRYLKNPMGFLLNGINQMLSRGYDSNHNDSFARVLKSTMRTDLARQMLEKDPTLDKSLIPAIEQVLDLHDSIVAYKSVLEEINSSYDMVQEMSNERTELYNRLQQLQKETGTVIAPSLEQLNVIRQLRKFLSMDSDSHHIPHVAYLQGLAGTGKTKVALKYLMWVSKQDVSKVLAFGHTDRSSETIADSLVDAKDPNKKAQRTTVQEFLEKDTFDQFDMIVLDEAAGLTGEQVSEVLNRVQEINKNRKNKIKLIMLGDPNQLTEGGNSAMENSTNMGIRRLNPLTSRFRSNVSSIVDVQDSFQGRRDKVTRINFQSNISELSSITEAPIGAYSSTQDNLTTVLKASLKTGSKKSRVIIVANNEAKAKYSEYLAQGVEVMNIVDVQGLTFQEVYVDISMNEQTPLQYQFWEAGSEGIRTFNDVMYTATSRASDFLYVVYPPADVMNIPATDLADKATRNSKLLDGFLEQFEETQNEISDALSKYELAHKQEIPPAKEPKTDGKAETPGVKDPTNHPPSSEVHDSTPDPDADLDIIPEGETRDPDINPDDGTVDTDAQFNPVMSPVVPGDVRQTEKGLLHNLLYPSYTAIKGFVSRLDGSKKPSPVRQGSRALYVVEDNAQYGRRVSIYGQVQNSEGKGTNSWMRIGILAEDEISVFPGNLQEQIKAVKTPNKFKHGSGDPNKIVGTLSFTENHPSILMEGTVSSKQAMSVQYGAPTTTDGTLKSLSQKMMNLFNAKEHKEQAQKNMDVNLRVFTYKDINSMSEEGFSPLAGVPYAEFTMKTDGGKPNKILVRLTPNKLNKSDEIMKPLADLYDAVQNAEQVFEDSGVRLGTVVFNKMIRGMKGIYEVVNNSLQIKDNHGYKNLVESGHIDADMISEAEFNEALPHLKRIFESAYGISSQPIAVTEAEFKEKYGNEELYKAQKSRLDPKDGEPLYYVQNLSDMDGNKRPRLLLAPYIQANQGPAVKSLNLIARANKTVGNQKLRVTNTDKRESGVHKFTTAIALLRDPLSEADYNSKQSELFIIEVDNILKNEMGKTGEKYKFSDLRDADKLVEILNEIEEIRGLTIEDIQNRIHATDPITSQTLANLNSFDDAGNHALGETSLRKPITMKDVANVNSQRSIEAKDRELSKLAGHQVSNVLQTSIEVALNPQIKQAPQDTQSENKADPGLEDANDSFLFFRDISRKKSLAMETIITDLEAKGLLKIEC